MRNLAIVLIAVFLSGCATTAHAPIRTDPQLTAASRTLAMDYLSGQKAGESYQIASDKYGRGVSEFYNLQEVQGCDRVGVLYWEPAVECRVKSGNKLGGVTWSNYSIFFSYSPELRSGGDKYLGLRIKNVIESSLAYSD